MGKEFWLDRWNTNAIGWHQQEVEPSLVKWASNRKPTRILVPLCGKTLDMVWLREQGYDVVGAELSPLACETFFNENKITFTTTKHGEHVIYEGGGIQIINGDFFTLTPELVGAIGAVYDRAALIALPSKLRGVYTQKIISLAGSALKSGHFEIFQIVLVRNPLDTEGPPYCVPPEEVKEHYEKSFDVKLLDRHATEVRGSFQSQTDECVLLLKPRN